MDTKALTYVKVDKLELGYVCRAHCTGLFQQTLLNCFKNNLLGQGQKTVRAFSWTQLHEKLLSLSLLHLACRVGIGIGIGIGVGVGNSF